VEFGVDFSLVNGLFLLLDLSVIFSRLLLSFFVGFAVVLSHLLNLQVEGLLFVTKTLELVLVLQFFGDVVCELIELQLGKLVLEPFVPVHEFLLVLFYFLLVALHVGVVLQLLAESVGRLLQVSRNSLNRRLTTSVIGL
jgi:hypothetical protein